MFRKIVYTIVCTLICWFLVGAVIGAVIDWKDISFSRVFSYGKLYVCYPLYGLFLFAMANDSSSDKMLLISTLVFSFFTAIYISIPIGVIYVLNKINSIKSRKNID